MQLLEEFNHILTQYRDNEAYFKRNTALYEINEGNIKPYILRHLAPQMSANTFKEGTFRVPPINLLRKIVDKLSTIYQPGPARSVTVGTESDKTLLDWYQECFKIDVSMNRANEYFNLFKNTLLHICLINGKPVLRVIPSDRFWVYGMDPRDPMRVTHIVLCNGVTKSVRDNVTTPVRYFTIWTDQQFLIVEETGDVRPDIMAAYENPEGINPYGKLPFIYVTSSANELIPLPDDDMMDMPLIIPECLNDLNAGLQYGVYPIKYTIGLNGKGMIYAANSMWEFKADPGQEGKTEIGTIDNKCDVDQGLSLIIAQLTLWFQSIGIRPGVIGEVNGNNFSSGISKIIDESDTTEHRLKQISYFQQAEDELWDFVVEYAHPYWLKAGLLLDQSLSWSAGVEISVNFAEPVPLQSRGDLIDQLTKEVAGGFTTNRRAVRTLNPQLSESELDHLLEEIRQEKASQFFIPGLGGPSSFSQPQQNVDNSPNQLQEQTDTLAEAQYVVAKG